MREAVKTTWRFRESASKPSPGLADELEISPALLGVLWRRGYQDKASLLSYLEPRLKNLTPPTEWPHVDNAAAILARDLLAGKKLAVWGDYDVDGITATALALDVIEEHGFAPAYHLPDRRNEGYGVNVAGVEKLARQGVQTLLTVDCGISNLEALGRAAELGMNVVITDHHLPPPQLPTALEIVDPRVGEPGEWPSENLAGVGVAFYLMAQVNNLLAPHTGRRYKMDASLDLVSLGTLADICQLDGENRILARAGLDKLARPGRLGLAALKAVSGFDIGAELSSDQVVYRLAPRINAAGRMGSPDLALRLLRCCDFRQAEALAAELDECNRSRKSEEERAFREAVAQIEEQMPAGEHAGLVVAAEGWHPGIVGIVASRLVEVYNVPAIVLTREGDTLKGSGRGSAGFDLYAALKKTARHLLGFGGHKMAAGLSLKESGLAGFRQEFSEVARESLGESGPDRSLLLDGELSFATAANAEFIRELRLMQPFGEGNEEPVFSSPLLEIKRIDPLGHSGEHVSLALYEKKSGITIKAKAWRRAREFRKMRPSQTIRIAYTPQLDYYRGVATVDLSIRDWREEKPV